MRVLAYAIGSKRDALALPYPKTVNPEVELMLISPERNDRLIREQVFQDVIELREILSSTDDLNASRERLKTLAASLEYILLGEA